MDIPYQHPYPFFFEVPYDEFDSYLRYVSKSFLFTLLRDMKEKQQSLLAHSGVFDHRQHGEHRGLGPAGWKIDFLH